MIIRKLFKFENAHIVRGCSTERCRSSIHGHSYKVEVLFESNFLDKGQMVFDFGLMKQSIKALVDSFDHAITLWDLDDQVYIEQMKQYSERWIVLPISPSAEQFSRVIFLMIDTLLKLTTMINGEKEVNLHSIIVHETDTGYAQCFKEDVYASQMGDISLEKIVFSDAIKHDWPNQRLWEKLLAKEAFINPDTV